jgi:hypothetical protein
MRRHRNSRRDHARAVQRFLNHVAQSGAPVAAPLPHYDKRNGKGWIGGDPRTLYAFVDQRTGATTVCPGGGQACGIGPAATARVATRREAEEHWQYPLNPGWRVA